MSLANDIGQFGSIFKDSVRSPLSFTFSELEVLFEALSHFQDHIFQMDDDPNCPGFYASDGEQYVSIVDRLINRFHSYKFM